MGFQSSDTRRIAKSVNDMVLGEVKRTFNPEFINRIDEIIVFEALSTTTCGAIMGLLVKQLNDNLVDRKLKIDADARGRRLDHRASPARTARTARGRCAARSSATSRIRCPRSSSAATCRAARSRSTSTAGTLAYRPAGEPSKQAASWPETGRSR